MLLGQSLFCLKKNPIGLCTLYSVPGSLSQEAIDLSEEDIWCMRGVLAALDLVFLYNAEVIAEGILRAINREKLLLVAERDKYHLLGTLREAIHGLK